MNFRSILPKLLMVAVTLAGLYFSLQVRLGEDALDMLPGPALQGDFTLLQQLGMINRVFISLELEPGRSAGAAGAGSELLTSAGLLGEKLAAGPLFREVFYRLPPGYEFQLAADLQRYLPVLADDGDLRRFAELTTPARLREKIREDYLALNSLAGLALRRQIQQDPLGFTGVMLAKLTALRGGMRLVLRDGYFVSSDGRHCLLWAESNIPLTSSNNAALVKRQIETALAVSLKDGVTARIIGPLPHTLANAETIRRDLGKLLPPAVIALVFFLVVFLRDWRAVLLVAVPFLAAPPAIALLAAVYGKVSAMALGFGIVLLGIGVDFAVHIYVGCRAGQTGGKIPGELRNSLLMAFLTTVTVFMVLLLSKVPAQRQMALLAIGGLSWALVLAWQLVPLLAGKAFGGGAVGSWMMGAPTLLKRGRRLRPVKLAAWLICLAGGLAVWPSLHFNGDLRALDVPSATVRDDERAFVETWGGGQEQAFVVAVAPAPGPVLDINDRVYAILTQAGPIRDVQSLATLLPGPQRQARNGTRWQDFWARRLPTLTPELEQAALANGFTSRAFQPFLDWVTAAPEQMAPGHLLDGPLRPFINSLYRKSPGPGAGSSGPEMFLAATIIPDIGANGAVLNRISREAPGATVLSNRRWRQKVEIDLKSDIIRLSAIAALLVVMICALFFRRFRPVIAVLAPVTSALAAMALFAALSGGELNIMHALMGIMVIGLSVDYGIFTARSCQTGVDGRAFLAVSVCAVSTLSGFGVLTFAAHPALHALGVTVLVGIGAAWPTALFITPVLLTRSGGGDECP
jgi:hypothetical protein